MPEIDFQANQFRTYRAAIDGISLGFIATGSGGYSPRKGETLQYDGTTVVLSDGREFADVPQLRSAIRERWFVPLDEVAPVYRPRPAGIRVRGTEQHGRERAPVFSVETQRAEEDVVLSVDDRRRRRESKNADAARRVPVESTSAWLAMKPDREVLEMVREMELELGQVNRTEPSVAPRKSEVSGEADLLDLLASIEALTVGQARPAPRAAQAAGKRYAVERQEDLHVTLGGNKEIVDDFGQPGSAVGAVGGRRRMPVERQQDIDLGDIAPAKPVYESPKPSPRLGGSGAIVVDEERDVGAIRLSGQGPIRMEEAAVASTSHESIRMGDVEVGRREARGSTEESGQEGVAVGRILSPTHRRFVADDSNTSSSAIERTQEGAQLRVEKFPVHAEEQEAGVVAKIARTRGGVATGDVQEAISGDDLPEILPDAATGPAPRSEMPPEVKAAYDVVRAVLPDFEWNRDRPLKQRIEDAMKHADNDPFFRGILAVETDLARAEIKKRLAETKTG